MEKLTGHGQPHKHLPGEVGQYYEDLNTGDIYECLIAQPYSPTHGWPVGGYIWDKVLDGDDVELTQEVVGGGSGNIDALIERSVTEINSDAKKVDSHVLSYYSELNSVNFPMARQLNASAFSGCSKLTNVNLPAVTRIGMEALKNVHRFKL